MSATDHTPPSPLLAKLRAQSAQIPLQDLRVVIAVHRAHCHQADCPILSIMEQDAKAREATL